MDLIPVNNVLPKRRFNVSTPTLVFDWYPGKDVHLLNVKHPDLTVSKFQIEPNQQVKLLFVSVKSLLEICKCAPKT